MEENKIIDDFSQDGEGCTEHVIPSKVKIKTEKRIMKLSLFGSILFMIVEGIMAHITNSHSILMDFVFDITELIMIGPFLLLVPLLYKPVTEKRPYGFAQIESLFLIVKYSLLFLVTLQLVIESVKTIIHGGNKVNAGVIAFFEFCVFLGCLLIYMILSHYSKRYESDTIRSELYVWKLDVFGSIGVSLAFFAQVILQRTKISFVTPYIDPIVAIIMSSILIVEPIKMIGKSLKELVLFAPNKEVMDGIRAVVLRNMEGKIYKLEFLDVIQTGRKTWVEIYISSKNDNISISQLSIIQKNIKSELKMLFDQVYVEIIPDVGV